MAMQLRSLLLGLVLLIGGLRSANSQVRPHPPRPLPPYHSSPPHPPPPGPPICANISRSDFDAIEPEFIFGTASAAYQFEGAAFEDGRGPSIWDHYTHTYPERIKDGSNADVTVDQYHRYKEDVQIMKNLNTDAYRLSISWSRVLPTGKLSGGVNRFGIQYYNNLIDELVKHNITPWVTIFHWDVPQSLEEEFGGMLSPRIVDHFRDYAEVLFAEFGDRVKHWITLNEPLTFTQSGYATGNFPPGRCSSWQTEYNCLGGDSATEPYAVVHNLLLSHAATVQLYRRKYQAGQQGIIGITLNSFWVKPMTNTTEDQAAANRTLDFQYGWFMNPVVYGDYPWSMRSLVGQRLPYFSEEQSESLKGSYDFIGLNYYTGRYSANDNTTYENASYLTDPHATCTIDDDDGVPIGPESGSSWLCIYPSGIEKILLYTKEKYNDPIIYITENGVSEKNDPKLTLKEALHDTNRIDYYRRHLCHIKSAMQKHVKVKGYFAWSLLDNFEWDVGYTVRFGIVYVDFKSKNLKRHYKASTYWFRDFLNNNIKGIREFGVDNALGTGSVYEI